MKRTMRVLVPLLLALLVVGCMIWYLFVYDRDFTRDLLLQQARYFEKQGNQAVASWFYEKAYFQSSNNEDVAIELAEQYRASGNYTKAEFTLANAIATRPSTKLYITLCQLYVEQDKLLDAVNMLDSVSDSTIKAELDALRPEAPVSNQAPGYYTQYISVSLSSTGSKIYCSTEGEYPSVADAPYSNPIPLPGGETLIYALSVADNGLVSPLARFGYTIGSVIEEVVFVDPAVDSEIRRILSLKTDDVIYSNDLWCITEFSMPVDAEDYSDLSKLPYIETLTIHNGISGQLNHIAALSNLKELALINCRPTQSELAIIAARPQLEKLTMTGCSLSSIHSLASATGLVYLDLSDNTIRDISALVSMSSLKELYMQRNALNDLGALTALNRLEVLDVSYNSLTSLSALRSMSTLVSLNAESNRIATLPAMDSLAGLTQLNLAKNKLTTLEPLKVCTAITELNVSDNELTDIAPLTVMNQLLRLDFSYNKVTEIPQWGPDNNLVSLNGAFNQISSVETLRGMPRLNFVNLDYNRQLKSIAPLGYCLVIMQVDVFGTAVTDVEALREMGVIVNFDPTLK